MIRVHHLNNSRSQRILWLLEELGVDYELVRYERDQETMLAPESLRQLHPLGKSPLLEDDGKVYAESGAIIQYLVDRYDSERQLSPAPDSDRRPRFDYWLHYAEGSAMPPLLLSLVFNRVRNGPMPFFVRPVARAIADKVSGSFIDPQLKLHFDYLEAELAASGWFASEDFSAADVMMSFPVEAGEKRVGYRNRPRLRQFLQAIHARPAYQRALERGGPYDLLG
ncbi:MAG: glutathione S-transferase [Rhodanobacteraceae bacterium]|nr:glutathione S-transferase [Xanthomonadales bacterium]MCP5478432.1 glutathione S-transferase [Rhodanobacteraceae bacterium]HPF72576.1 glutathione S-transferase [Xanthomonadaceae bacterium]HRX99920.1 glutathione S-transferase [Xanthomonadaceae bacterium]